MKKNPDLSTILKTMTLKEKISLCSGKDFWHTKSFSNLGIPSLTLADGPHGIRKQENATDHLGLSASKKATCFPTASACANSWDRSLLHKLGVALGEEAIGHGVDILLGPGINIKRSPLCGRNFEYFSEDPYLTGELASTFISGVQSKKVGVCVKHFAANNQEKDRMVADSLVDERALREIY